MKRKLHYHCGCQKPKYMLHHSQSSPSRYRFSLCRIISDVQHQQILQDKCHITCSVYCGHTNTCSALRPQSTFQSTLVPGLMSCHSSINRINNSNYFVDTFISTLSLLQLSYILHCSPTLRLHSYSQ